MRIVLALFVLLLATVAAQAQTTILQSGPYRAGHAPMYVIDGQGQPIAQDSGSAGGGAVGAGLAELLVTARGSGTPPYASQGSGPAGTNICAYDAPITNATGYHYLCLSANAQGGGLIAYGAGGGAAPLPLNFLVNGVLAPYGSGGSGITALTGDVTASGTGSVAASVVRLQGRNMASTAPADGQVLTWVAGSSQWQPIAAPSGNVPVGGTTGQALVKVSATNYDTTWATISPTGVTSVASGTGLTGGPITSTGTLSLANTAVTPGTYGSATQVGQFVVDQQGRITSATSVAISSSAGTVTQVNTGTGLTGGPITTTGTISLANTIVTPGTYGSATQVPQITVDAQGRLTSAANILITSSGNVSGPGVATVGNVATWNNVGGTLLANTAPGALSVLATGTTTARTLAARAAEVFNVKDYGAACDGVTDDVTAIQAAATAASVAGGTVLLPAGICVSSGTITVSGHSVTVRGQGPFTTVLNCTGAGTGNCLVIGNQVDQKFYINVVDMGLTAASRTGGDCLYVRNTALATVERVYMINCFNGMQVTIANDTAVRDFDITGIAGTYGVRFGGPVDPAERSDVLSLARGIIQANWSGADGIQWDGAAFGLWIDDVTVLRVDRGLHVQNTTVSTTAYPTFLFANHLEIEGAMSNAVLIAGGFGFQISNSYFNNFHGAPSQGNADGDCVTINPDLTGSITSNISIVNSHFGFCGARGITMNARNIQLSNANIRQVNMLAAAWPVTEIGANAEDVQVNNLITWTQGDTIAAPYAVTVNASAVRVSLCGIDGRGALTSTFSSGTNSVQICNSINPDGTVLGLGIGLAPTSTEPLVIFKTAAGAGRGMSIYNNGTTAGTAARATMSTGTANAYSIFQQNDGPTPYTSIYSGAGNTAGIFIDSSALATAPITLIPGASTVVSVSGRLAATSYQAVTVKSFNTAPTINAAFGTSPSIVAHNGTAAFRVDVGSGGVANAGAIGLPAAANGWACSASNISSTSGTVFLTKQVATTTTTASFANYDAAGALQPWIANDNLLIQCTAY